MVERRSGIDHQAAWSNFQRLWSKAVGMPGYDKEEWKRLEDALLAMFRTETGTPLYPQVDPAEGDYN